jgi:hypothetical protein
VFGDVGGDDVAGVDADVDRAVVLELATDRGRAILEDIQKDVKKN